MLLKPKPEIQIIFINHSHIPIILIVPMIPMLKLIVTACMLMVNNFLLCMSHQAIFYRLPKEHTQVSHSQPIIKIVK